MLVREEDNVKLKNGKTVHVNKLGHDHFVATDGEKYLFSDVLSVNGFFVPGVDSDNFDDVQKPVVFDATVVTDVPVEVVLVDTDVVDTNVVDTNVVDTNVVDTNVDAVVPVKKTKKSKKKTDSDTEENTQDNE